MPTPTGSCQQMIGLMPEAALITDVVGNDGRMWMPFALEYFGDGVDRSHGFLQALRVDKRVAVPQDIETLHRQNHQRLLPPRSVV